MFERFTESARAVVVSAQEAARELGHAHIGTEHQLLGLLANRDSDASRVLQSLGVTADRARGRVLEIVAPGEQRVEGFIPFTPRAKKVFELSLREALGLGHRNITPEHLLLGLAHERDGVAMHVLVGLGADETAIRAAVLPLMAAPDEADPQTSHASQFLVEMFPSDPVIRRLLTTAGGRALNDRRSQFGLSDLLASVAFDEEAAGVLASLGVDVDGLREAIERADGLEESTG